MTDGEKQGIVKFRTTVTPYLCASDAAGAIEFYKQAFGAKETMRLAEPGGRIGHAEVLIGDARIMISDEYPELGVVSPQSLGGSPVTIVLNVEDVDRVVARAVAAGAKILRPVQDQFYGERTGQLLDPAGHKWGITTHLEDVSPEEMKRRVAELFGGS